MDDYTTVLHALTQAQVQYAVIGTWALQWHFPAKMADYTVTDCDVVLAPDFENVSRAMEVLWAEEWEICSWERLMTRGVEAHELAGRIYLRATKGAATLDLTYECVIPWGQMTLGIVCEGGLKMASVQDILALKRHQGLEKNDLSAYDAMLKRLRG